MGAYDVVRIIVPEFTLTSYQYERHQTNEAFSRCSSDPGEREPLSEAEKTARRLASYELALRVERRDGAQGLVKVAIVFVIASVAFFVHWRLARRARGAANVP
jgi:hypothetical protein